MTASKLTTFFSFVLLFAASSFAHAQNGVCRVTAYSVDHSIVHSPIFSASTLVGEFDLKFEGTMISKWFQHKESEVEISVVVTRMKSIVLSKKPTVLSIAIQLFKMPQDGYSFYGGTAESVYDKNWKGSSVSSHLRVGDYKGYTFTVACEKSKK